MTTSIPFIQEKKLFHLISRPRSNPTIKLAWKMSSHEKGKRFFEYGTATKMPSGCFVYRLEGGRQQQVLRQQKSLSQELLGVVLVN